MRIIFKTLAIAIIALGMGVEAKESTTGTSSLKSALKHYKQLHLDGKMIETLEYVYPPIFEITPKQMLADSFKMAKDSGKLPKITNMEIKAKIPLKSYEKGEYTTIDYTMKMVVDMTPPAKKEDKEEYAKVQKLMNNPEELKSYKSFMVGMLKNGLGENVTIENKEGSMIADIEKSSTMIAINENKSGWKFLEVVPQMVEHLKNILPKEVLMSEKEMFDVEVLTPEEQLEKMIKLMKK